MADFPVLDPPKSTDLSKLPIFREQWVMSNIRKVDCVSRILGDWMSSLL